MTRRGLFKSIAAGIASIVAIRGSEAATKPLSGDRAIDTDMIALKGGTAAGGGVVSGYWWTDGEPDIYSFEDGEPI